MFGLFKSTRVNAKAAIKAMPLAMMTPGITPTVIDFYEFNNRD